MTAFLINTIAHILVNMCGVHGVYGSHCWQQYNTAATSATLDLSLLETVPWANAIEAWMGATDQTLSAIGTLLAVCAFLRKPLRRLFIRIKMLVSGLCSYIGRFFRPS